MSKPQTSIFRQESLERLSSPEQLDQLMQVIRPKSWIPLATLGSLIFAALLWGVLGRIPITASGTGLLVRPNERSKELLGLAYFHPSEGNRIQLGMPILLVPDTAGSQQTGGLVGRVKQISDPPIATLDDVRHTTDADPQTQTIEVVVELEQDPTTVSGYKWTSAGGRQLRLMPGTDATARITLAERAPITFVFPFLEASQ